MARSARRSGRRGVTAAAWGLVVAVLAAGCSTSAAGGAPAPDDHPAAAPAAAATTSTHPSTARATTPAPRATATPTAVARTTPAASSTTAGPAKPATAGTSTAGTALAALARLTVKGRAPMTGYSRAQFGPAWADVDHNGCDTRNDILARDLTSTTFKAGTHDCTVLTGVLADPYTATTIHFTRGVTTSTAVQIDHLVALGDAWQTGAQQLSAATREALANDPLNLLAVDGPANESKGDGDAATWLPPSKAFRCQYVARQVAVKTSYGLWVTPAEHDAIAGILATCPAQALPTAGTKTVVAATVGASASSGHDHVTIVTKPQPAAPAPAAKPAAKPVAKPAPASVYYANCAAVRAAGAAPISAGDPGYSRTLDRDGDGVACE